MSEPTLTAQQIAAAQTKLRAALGLPPEAFAVSTFIGMVSDEIEQLRAQGRDDADIAALLRSAAAVDVKPEGIARHYASSEARGKPPQ